MFSSSKIVIYFHIYERGLNYATNNGCLVSAKYMMYSFHCVNRALEKKAFRQGESEILQLYSTLNLIAKFLPFEVPCRKLSNWFPILYLFCHSFGFGRN